MIITVNKISKKIGDKTVVTPDTTATTWVSICELETEATMTIDTGNAFAPSFEEVKKRKDVDEKTKEKLLEIHLSQ